MKIRILALLSVLLMLIGLFSLTAAAYSDKEYNFAIAVPENYTVINTDNVTSNQDFLQKINYTASGFKDYLSKNNIVFYAINKNDGSEIILKCVSSEFSKSIDDMCLLGDDSIESIADKILQDKSYVVCEKNGSKFLKVAIASEDRGGSFFGSQYITVKNSYIYSLSVTFQDSATTAVSSEIENDVLESFYIEENSGFTWEEFGDIIITVIIILCIILFVIVAGYVIYTFINDIRTKNSSNDVAPYVKIKRRKF